jgi:hypothetical protein
MVNTERFMRLIATALVASATLAPTPARSQPAGSDSIPFAETIARLSGTGGYFDTDNLISNETGYLHVVPGLLRAGLRGGAYLGVGPDQNYSYIAALRPDLAIVVDLRRDNLLHHLLLKALIQISPTRADYLANLTGRPLPAGDPESERDVTDLSADALVEVVAAAPVDSANLAAVRRRVISVAASFGVPLDRDDLETLTRFHGEFVRWGMGLKFTSAGRAPRAYYPTLGALIAATDLEGTARGYLASEAAYRTVRGLHLRGRIIPVVGDLAGDEALPAVASLLRERGLRVNAFYTSNVEFYLVRQGTFDQFAEGVVALPHGPDAVLIRSVFLSSFWGEHPLAVPGHASVQVLERIDDFSESQRSGEFRSYADLATLNVFR